VTGAFDLDQGDRRRNQLDGGFQFVQRAEWILGAMDEPDRRLELGKVLRPEPVWLARWMQGIRKQQQAIHQARSFGGQDAGLAAPVGMPSEQ